MSDLGIYELEDIIWDEFGQSEDHIVPHSSDENTKELSSPAESRKKPRFKEIGVSSNTGDKYAVECVNQEKEETDFSTVNIPNNTMLEKGSWSHKSDKMFSASCDTDRIKKVTSLASENNRMSSHELCSVDPILNGRCTAVDSNSYRYPPTHISQTEIDLRFNDNAHEDKESNDLLYYSWHDIENFEDVARIFRGCDSSFALGSAGKEGEVGLFSVSDAIEGSEDASKLDFKLSCPDSYALTNLSEDIEPSRLKHESSSVNDSNMKSATVSYKSSSRRSEIDEPASLSHLSSMNGYSQISESQDDFILRDEGLEFSEVQFRSPTNQSKNDNRMSLLCDPNPNSPVNSEAARMFSEHKHDYNRRVCEIVEQSWTSDRWNPSSAQYGGISTKSRINIGEYIQKSNYLSLSSGSVSCEDLEGVGSFDTTCLLNSDLYLNTDLYVFGNGNLEILPHVSIFCPIEGCVISFNVSGNAKVGHYAAIVAGSVIFAAASLSFGPNSCINTTSLGGSPPSQTSDTPVGYDGAGGGHGGRGASCLKSNQTKYWGGDVYAWSTLSEPWS